MFKSEPVENLTEEQNEGRFERDLRDLISAAGADVAEKARRERLLRHLESADKAHPLELASTAWSELERLLRRKDKQ